MKQNIPLPLQSQILLHAALAAVSLIAGFVVLFFFAFMPAVPFLLFAALTALNAWRIYYAAANGFCVILKGAVLKVERSAVLRRPRAVVTEIDGKALRVALRSRLKAPGEGEHIAVYVLDNAPVYEWRGIHQLSSYLALAVEDRANG